VTPAIGQHPMATDVEQSPLAPSGRNSGSFDM
jgi:hypothetical protein